MGYVHPVTKAFHCISKNKSNLNILCQKPLSCESLGHLSPVFVHSVVLCQNWMLKVLSNNNHSKVLCAIQICSHLPLDCERLWKYAEIVELTVLN